MVKEKCRNLTKIYAKNCPIKVDDPNSTKNIFKDAKNDIEVSMIEFWRLCLLRDLEIYKNLNKFHTENQSSILTSNFWIPDSFIDKNSKNDDTSDEIAKSNMQDNIQSKTEYLEKSLKDCIKDISKSDSTMISIELCDHKKPIPNYFQENAV